MSLSWSSPAPMLTSSYSTVIRPVTGGAPRPLTEIKTESFFHGHRS